MARREERRVHPHGDPIREPLRRPDQLQRQPELARVRDVGDGDADDPVVADVVDVDRCAEREPREDRHLRRRVGAADVVARIGLGVAQLLRLPERLLIAAAGPRHLAEDEVGGPVDDPVDPLDVRARERLAQHADDGHDAGDRRLEAEVHSMLARERPQLLAVAREQLLVGGDDVAPALERAPHVLARVVDAADQLDDEVGALEDLVEIAGAPREHADQLGRPPGQPLDLPGALPEQPLECRADRAVPEQPDPERVHPDLPAGGACPPGDRCMHRPRVGTCADPRHTLTSRECRSWKVSRRMTTRASPSRQKITGGRGTPL